MRLVVLDRDGVINCESDAYIKSPVEWTPISGSLEAIARLTKAGFTISVATNQAGLARGLFDRVALKAIHHKMQIATEERGGKLAGVFVCPHAPWDNCNCRKPKPGLLNQIAQRFGVSLNGVPIIGDSLRDIEAAESVGARPILVRTGYGENTLQNLDTKNRAEVFADLASAADRLIGEL